MNDENQNPEQNIQNDANNAQNAINDAHNQAQGAVNDQQDQGADTFGGAWQKAEDQIDQTIDQLGKQIPGGSQFTDQAKKSAGSILDNLKQQAEKRLGGLFGSHKES